MRHVLCILLLEWSTTSQRLWVYGMSVLYTQINPQEFWSLVSTIDGSFIPQDCVEEQLYPKHEVTGKTYNKKKCNRGHSDTRQGLKMTRHWTLSFLKIDMRHWGHPTKGPSPVTAPGHVIQTTWGPSGSRGLYHVTFGRLGNVVLSKRRLNNGSTGRQGIFGPPPPSPPLSCFCMHPSSTVPPLA